MKRVGKIVFNIFCTAIIIALIVLLVVRNKKDDTTTYANILTLNIPRELTIEKDVEYTLPNNYLTVYPTKFQNQVSYTITNKAGEIQPDFLFNGKTIKCNISGFFYIKFSVQGENEVLNETLVVQVITPDVKMTQQIFSMQVNELHTLDEVFNITAPNSAEISVSISNTNLYYYDLTEKFLAKSVGSVNITIEITYKSKIYAQTFSLTITSNNDNSGETGDSGDTGDSGETGDSGGSGSTGGSGESNGDDSTDETKYSITIENCKQATMYIVDNVVTIECTVNVNFSIEYSVNSTDGEVDQHINYFIENTEMLIDNSSFIPPIIKFSPLVAGNTTITLSSPLGATLVIRVIIN